MFYLRRQTCVNTLMYLQRFVPKYDEWRNSIQWFSTYYFRLIHIYKHTIVLLEESYLNLFWYSSTISRIRSLCSCTYCSKLRASDIGRLSSFTASFNALFFLRGSERLRSHVYRHMTSEKLGRCWQTVRGWVSKHSIISYVRYNFLLRVFFWYSTSKCRDLKIWLEVTRGYRKWTPFDSFAHEFLFSFYSNYDVNLPRSRDIWSKIAKFLYPQRNLRTCLVFVN